tara:strand:- start:297 stop:818 length:522 start_codon:yes stop_codon:yes gene_type:complete
MTGLSTLLKKGLKKLSKDNAKKTIEKISNKTLTKSDEKTLDNFLKQKDEDLITESELSAKIINKFIDKSLPLNEYKINFKVISPKMSYRGEKSSFRIGDNLNKVTIKASSKDEAKKLLKETPQFKNAYKYVSDNIPSSAPTNPRLVIKEIIEKKKGGTVMKDYYKNYNTQRDI